MALIPDWPNPFHRRSPLSRGLQSSNDGLLGQTMHKTFRTLWINGGGGTQQVARKKQKRHISERTKQMYIFFWVPDLALMIAKDTTSSACRLSLPKWLILVAFWLAWTHWLAKLCLPALEWVIFCSLKKRLSVLAQWSLYRALWRDP